MRLQNSYIFLKNEYNTDLDKPKMDEDGILVLEMGNSVISYINRCYPGLKSDNRSGDFFRKSYSLNIEKEKCSFQISFYIHNVIDITYLDVCVEGKRKAQIIECLEEIQSTLLNSGIRTHYIDIISYDAVSEYYCNKIFSHLNALERNLRKLFFNIYVLNFGTHYYGETIDKSLKDGLMSVLKKATKDFKDQYRKDYSYRNKHDFEEIITIQRLFYSFDYSDMQKFLFAPTWSEYDKKSILAKYDDLSFLSDEELRAIISGIEPQNNWTRFFSDKVKLNDIEMIFNSIREYRNAVAHFKFFNKEDYLLCLKEVNKLNKAVLKAIKVTEDEDFDKKNMEHIKEMIGPSLERLANVMGEFVRKVSESANRFLKSEAFSNMQKVFKRLGEIAYDCSDELSEDEVNS